MAVRGITFSNQNVSSIDDSNIFEILLNGRKGSKKGCKMTFGIDDIYISKGYFFAANRLIEIPSTETVATPVVTSGTTYCRLVFEIDLTKLNTTSQFNQGYFKILSSTAAYPEITQEDLMNGGDIYQLPFARFTKTASGIGSFVAELDSIGFVTGNQTIYVSTSGNDASGDGSESFPFATIQHAVDSISQNLGNKEITINVASGTYLENVLVTGFHGGTLKFTFGIVSLKSFTVHESCVIMTGSSLTFSASGNTYGLLVRRDGNVISQIPITVNGAVNGIYIAYGGRFIGRNPITINSCTNAVTSSFAALASFADLTGSRNNNGVQASGGIAMIGSIAAAMASTLYITSAGGRIYTGAQASVPAY